MKLAEKSCTGCSACAMVCPQQCITMLADEEGFLFPQIDAAQCRECGLCEKICPVLHPIKTERESVRAYAAYSTDEQERLASSSGGIFSLLAKEVLAQGGVVFGAAFDENFLVHHIEISSLEELELLQGSKYLQSRMEDSFQEVKTELESGKQVLFSGVSCQISGLKSFLKRDYPNLLTVDVLCHGVPSPKVWKKYIEEQEKNHAASLRRMFFRHKTYGWKKYAVSFEYSNDTADEQVFGKDLFMQMFLQNICLRCSCYECRFNSLDRESDITLGDCWSIDDVFPDMNDDKGISVVLTHSKKGQEWLAKIGENLILREGDVEKLLPVGSGGRTAVKMHPKRDKFFRKLNQGTSIQELVRLIKQPFPRRVHSFCRRALGKAYRTVKKFI